MNMSYAVETKKRKFDRILEALSESAASPARTSLNARNNASTTTLTQDSASDSSKRRRVTPTAKATVPSTSVTWLSGHYLPASRTAFLQRLETFRHVTQWHISSTEPINAAAWAKRGWICVDTDTIYCGACKERVHVDLDADPELLKNQENNDGEEEEDQADQDDSFVMSSEIHENMVKRYQEMIVTAHGETCLWRKRGCDSSIQRIEGLLNTSIAISGLWMRYDSIMNRAEEVPRVGALPDYGFEATESLERFRFNDSEKPHLDALKLAVCGWERKCEDVIECRHCFRSLGLWLYRGETPAMERLEAVEDHLEYCPWRSTEAQDTEIVVGGRKDSEGSLPNLQRVAGWALVLQAMLKDNIKRGSKQPVSTSASETELTSTASNDSQTPEQREKKMRDLLRRIKEIKKPFNVKSLLKRKDKGQAG
jgi:hypothetical protein